VGLDVIVERGPGEVSRLTAGDGTLQVGLHLLLVSLAQVNFSLPLSLELGFTFLAGKREASLMKLQVRV